MSAIWFSRLDLQELPPEQCVETEFELDQLPRLRASVLPGSGPVSAKLELRRNRKALLLDGAVAGALQMQCTRCLEPMLVEVKSSMQVALVPPQRAEGEVPEDFERVVVEDKPIRLVDLVEDELIMSIPFASRHDLPVCNAPTDGQDEIESAARSEGTTQPFADLDKLLSKRKD